MWHDNRRLRKIAPSATQSSLAVTDAGQDSLVDNLTNEQAEISRNFVYNREQCDLCATAYNGASRQLQILTQVSSFCFTQTWLGWASETWLPPPKKAADVAHHPLAPAANVETGVSPISRHWAVRMTPQRKVASPFLNWTRQLS